MALRTVVATGNWSNPAIWNGGVLPGPGDTVASNNFTVTIDQNINVGSLTNAAQSIVGLVPNMTSSTTPSGIVTASISEIGTYAAFNAFGGDFNTEWRPGAPAWIAYEFSTTKAVNQYFVHGFDGGAMTWTFEGWNGSAWVVLHSISAVYSSGYTSPLIGNSTAYIKYRLNFSSSPTRIHTIQFYEYLGTTAAVAGGGFILNGGYNITCNNLDYIHTAGTLISMQGTGNSTITAPSISNGSYAVSRTGNVISTNTFTGNLTIQGTLYINRLGGSGSGILISSNCVVNYIGDLRFYYDAYIYSHRGIRITSASTLNFTGNLFFNLVSSPQDVYGIKQEATSTINLTGNISGYGASAGIQNSGFSIAAGSTVIITGNITNLEAVATKALVESSSAAYCSIIGVLTNLSYSSTNASAINILSGPFVSNQYGGVPYQCIRMHLIPSTSNYFEFRDETTNGALSPGAIAPATRMIAPAGVSDAPIPANVRYGTVYANGSLVGTLRMPNASSVAYGVAVDNTIGSAVLTPQSVWDFAIANLNTSGSIGERLKKVATVDSTGAQLSSFEF
jgi:hypothetical protein